MRSRWPLTTYLAAGAVLASVLGWSVAFAQREGRQAAPGRAGPPPGRSEAPRPQAPAEKKESPATTNFAPPTSFFPVVGQEPIEQVLARDQANKPKLNRRARTLLDDRYDLSDRPAAGVKMSGGKAVQTGVRVKLPEGVTWEKLGQMTPAQIRERDLFPKGFMPLPHATHDVGGQVFPAHQIDSMKKLEQRDLVRVDIDFDMPDHLMPEFPPPIFLSNHPELGDVSQGQVLSIRNYFKLFNGLLTPVQLDGLRQLLTPFPQQQFNQTDDRKVMDASLGVTCLDCHVNGHTNAAFHLTPDIRPQSHRFRLDTPSLRGMFNQQIHGSKRSLRSIEDFTEFEQRTAYFDGDQVTAAKKGVNEPDRATQVAMMAQMQNMFDFPPAPKLDVFGQLDPAKATEEELQGQKLFFGKARCVACHKPPFYLDDKMHDLKTERFFKPRMANGLYMHADGPIKTFTLRGIKDSPPFLHDGRLLTLEDTVEFFNVVTELKLNAQEKQALVAFMRAL